MDTPTPPIKPVLQVQLDRHMQALQKLRAQMLHLHARLEYLRLMARLRRSTGQPPL